MHNPFTNQSLDMRAYKQKFERCRQYLQGKKEILPELLSDPTTFSYLFFKNNEGARLELYPYQDAIINDAHRYIYFRASNQIGKSALFNFKAARNLLIDHGHHHNEAIVSKSLPQSIFQMRRVKTLLNSMQPVAWKDEKGQADSMSVISVDVKDENDKVKYTNMLVCAPCTEGLLGYDLHDLNLDEFEYWEIDTKRFFNQIAQPRTYTTKGKILVMTNPNGNDSFGAELERQKLKDGRRKWHVYIFNYLDKPDNTQKEFDELKYSLPRQEFESTVAAIRSISSRNYFTPDEIERSYDPKLKEDDVVGKQPYFFLDVGAKHDQSVLAGGYLEVDEGYDKEKDEVYNKRHIHVYIPIIHVYPVGYPLSRVVGSVSAEQESDGWHVEKSVDEYLKEWAVNGIIPMFGCDVTGNSGIIPLFETINISPIDITFSGPAKSGMYQRFKYMMEKGLIHRIKSKEWEYQASHLEMKKSVRGYLTIHHEKESDLDDCMDSCAGLIHCMDNPDYVQPSFTII